MKKYKLTFKTQDSELELRIKVEQAMKEMGFRLHRREEANDEYVLETGRYSQDYMIYVDYVIMTVDKFSGIAKLSDFSKSHKFSLEQLKLFDTLGFETGYRQYQNTGQDITDWWDMLYGQI